MDHRVRHFAKTLLCCAIAISFVFVCGIRAQEKAKERVKEEVKIIGHTDSDGDDAMNLDLSKRRSAAVRASLSKDFGIDASRMQTDGKGASQPAEPNSTPQGKANIRRVEFVKL